jgi:hypothetical protein
MFCTASFEMTGIVFSAAPRVAKATLTYMPIFNICPGFASSIRTCAVRVAVSIFGSTFVLCEEVQRGIMQRLSFGTLIRVWVLSTLIVTGLIVTSTTNARGQGNDMQNQPGTKMPKSKSKASRKAPRLKRGEWHERGDWLRNIEWAICQV